MDYKIAEQDLGVRQRTHHDVLVDAIGEVFNRQPHLVTFLIPSPEQAEALEALEMEVVTLRTEHVLSRQLEQADEALLLHFFKNRIEDLVEMFVATSLGPNMKHRIPRVIDRGSCFGERPRGAFLSGTQAHVIIYAQAVAKDYRERARDMAAEGVLPREATKLGDADTTRIVELGRLHLPQGLVLHTEEPVADIGKALMRLRATREQTASGGFKLALEIPCPVYAYNKNLSLYTCG